MRVNWRIGHVHFITSTHFESWSDCRPLLIDEAQRKKSPVPASRGTLVALAHDEKASWTGITTTIDWRTAASPWLRARCVLTVKGVAAFSTEKDGGGKPTLLSFPNSPIIAVPMLKFNKFWRGLLNSRLNLSRAGRKPTNTCWWDPNSGLSLNTLSYTGGLFPNTQMQFVGGLPTQ